MCIRDSRHLAPGSLALLGVDVLDVASHVSILLIEAAVAVADRAAEQRVRARRPVRSRLLTCGLARLAKDGLLDVLDALALVGLGRPEAADLGGRGPQLLPVDPREDQ